MGNLRLKDRILAVLPSHSESAISTREVLARMGFEDPPTSRRTIVSRALTNMADQNLIDRSAAARGKSRGYRWKKLKSPFKAALAPDQVRAARRQLGWSISDLATQVGLTAWTIGNFERGGQVRAIRKFDRVRAAFEAAGVKISELGRS